jgi:hypothetical protein
VQRWTRRSYLERLLAECRAADPKATLRLQVNGCDLEVEAIHADFLLGRPMGGGLLAIHPFDGVIGLPDAPPRAETRGRMAHPWSNPDREDDGFA